MKYLARLVVVLMALPLLALGARASVEVNINLSTQRMQVLVNGQHYATWRISSGRRGYFTPRGTYRPTWLKRMHYSRKYDNAPMPYSIFFYRGYAIHGTNVVSRLGRPASHGCVRLHPSNAAKLFSLVKQHGRKNVRIRVMGDTRVAYANLPKTKPRRAYKRKKTRYSRKLRKARKAQARRLARQRAQERRRRGEFVQVYGTFLTR